MMSVNIKKEIMSIELHVLINPKSKLKMACMAPHSSRAIWSDSEDI